MVYCFLCLMHSPLLPLQAAKAIVSTLLQRKCIYIYIYIYIYIEFKNILSSVVNVSIYYLHQYLYIYI